MGKKSNANDPKKQNTRSVTEYRKERARSGAYKGKYYGPDAFKGDAGMLKRWRAAGSPDAKSFAAKEAKSGGAETRRENSRAAAPKRVTAPKSTPLSKPTGNPFSSRGGLFPSQPTWVTKRGK